VFDPYQAQGNIDQEVMAPAIAGVLIGQMDQPVFKVEALVLLADLAVLNCRKGSVALKACDKEKTLVCNPLLPVIIAISLVKNIDLARPKGDIQSLGNVVHVGIGDINVGQIARAMIVRTSFARHALSWSWLYPGKPKVFGSGRHPTGSSDAPLWPADDNGGGSGC
jgi:hypothetical protein